MILFDQHDRATQHLTEDNLFDFCRLERVGNQVLRISVPTNNINLLAAQLLLDRANPATANTDTCPHTVDLLVFATDRHLAAVPRLTRHRVDLDDTLGNLRNLLLEQTLHQLRPRATQDHLDPRTLGPHVRHDRLDPLIGMKRLLRNLLAPRQNRLDRPQGDRGDPTLVSLHHPRDQLVHLRLKLFDQSVSFGLAELLYDHLLGRLRTNSTDHFLIFQVGAVAVARNLALFPVDLKNNACFFAVVLPSSRHQGGLDGAEHDLLFDILVPVHRIDNSQQITGLH